MSKKMTKAETKPVRKFSIEEAKEFVFECIESNLGAGSLLKEYAEGLEKYESLSKEKKGEMNQKLTKLSFAFGVETGHVLANCSGEEFQKVSVEMKKGLEKEFNCQSVSEKALVDLAVGAYVRSMSYMWKMGSNQQYLGRKYDGYREYLSREIDRAHRHYISAIETLRIIKNPSLRVSVRANTAFIGENQQFNNHQTQRDENNEVK